MRKMTALLLTVVLLLSAVCLADNGWTCPSCGAANDANFCTQCGTKKPQGSSCPFCGTAFNGNADFAFCPNCGGNLKAESSKSDAPSGNANGVISASLVNGGIGNTVVFGKYEQNAYMPDGKEDIEWIVLDVKGCDALLISKKGLECIRYSIKEYGITWESSALRTWMNDEFYNAAFTNSEKRQIKKSTVTADQNSLYDRSSGGVTQDYVFALSNYEAEHYFSGNSARICKPSNKAILNGAYVNPNLNSSWWWLRTPGKNATDVCSVNTDGSIDYNGGLVSSNKGVARPCIWITFD